MRPRGDRSFRAGVVLGGGDGNHTLAVAVGDIEHRAGDICPVLHRARARAVIDTIRGAGPEYMEDGLGHVAREGKAAQLVVHDGDAVEGVFGVRHAIGQCLHGLDKVTAVTDDPGAAHDVVARAPQYG